MIYTVMAFWGRYRNKNQLIETRAE